METLSEISGYAASTLVLFTFVAKHASPAHHRHLQQPRLHHLRDDRVAAARPFPAPGVAATEHCSTCRDCYGCSSHGCRCPTLGGDMTSRDQSSVAPWPILLSTSKTACPA